MRIKATFILTLAVLIALSTTAHAATPAGQFTPSAGEPVKLWHHSIQAGHLQQAQAYFLNTLVPRLKGDGSLQDSYFLVDEENNKILAVSFWGKADAKVHPHTAVVDEAMRAHASEPKKVVDYKLVLINDEGLLPQTVDKVAVMVRKVKPGKMEDAKRVMREVVFPHLTKVEFTRNSYVLENAAENELISLVFMRGDYKVPDGLADKKDKHLSTALAASETTTEYTLFAIANE